MWENMRGGSALTPRLSVTAASPGNFRSGRELIQRYFMLLTTERPAQVKWLWSDLPTVSHHHPTEARDFPWLRPIHFMSGEITTRPTTVIWPQPIRRGERFLVHFCA